MNVISCMQSAFRRKWSLVRVLWLVLQESLSLLAQQRVCRSSHAADASWNELVYRLFLSLLGVLALLLTVAGRCCMDSRIFFLFFRA